MKYIIDVSGNGNPRILVRDEMGYYKVIALITGQESLKDATTLTNFANNFEMQN